MRELRNDCAYNWGENWCPLDCRERMNKCVFELEVETLEMEEKWSTSSFLRIPAKTLTHRFPNNRKKRGKNYLPLRWNRAVREDDGESGRDERGELRSRDRRELERLESGERRSDKRCQFENRGEHDLKEESSVWRWDPSREEMCLGERVFFFFWPVRKRWKWE